jgi:glyoxylase-like metal-dependent hydrolase (beta-lactamase superfamily II)
MVTHDAITGHSGPCVICPGITHNSAAAMQSLTRLATLDAATVLPGHGEPWPGTLATAARAALDHGIRPSALHR